MAKNLGWLLPETLTGYDLLCVTLRIPDNLEYRAAFMGALHMLDVWFNWEKTGDTRAAQAAAYWRELLDTYLFVGEDCDMPLDVRQNSENPCILEKTYNDGETWVEWANLQLCPPKLRLGAYGTPQYSTDDGATWQDVPPAPIPVRPSPPEGQDQKCLAAANAVAVLVATYQETVNIFTDGGALLIVASGVISVLATLIFYPPALPLVLEFFVALYGILEDLTASDFDSTTQHDLQCILDCNASEVGNVVTFDFTAVYDDVHSRMSLTPVNIWAAIDYLLSIVGEDGLNRAGATTSVTSADCSDCGCTECAYDFNFLADASGWYAYLGRGAWVDGSGWTNNSAGEYIQIGVSLGETVFISTVEVSFTVNPTRAFNLRGSDVDGTEFALTIDVGTPSPAVFEVNTSASGLWLSLDSYPDTQGGYVTHVCVKT